MGVTAAALAAALALTACGEVEREPLATGYEPGAVFEIGQLQRLISQKRLRGPAPVVRDELKNVIALDRRRRVVRVSGPTGTPIATLDGSDSPAGRFRRPVAVAADGIGTVYVLDAGRRRIVTYVAPTG